MSSRQIELALKKQRLQLASASLRDECLGHLAGLAPACAVVDSARDGALWLRRHPEALVAVLTALIVARPSRLWRWSRRAVFAWQAWRRIEHWRTARSGG